MADDGELLREYARSGAEAAFAEFVRRRLDFVYSTALRVVGGDAFLAKDVSQSVFIDAARKALALSNRRRLTGWLYTSTCFAAAKAVRAERRRQAREQKAYAMQEQPRVPHPEPDWEKIRPVLDALMLELKDTDREALLLRFFEHCSLADVGKKLGLSENAARMRVDRALGKLQALLARRGISSTMAVLALSLANQTLVAAPVGLAASIASVSVATVATGAGLSLLTLIAMSKTKTAIIATIIAAGLVTPMVVQHQTNRRLKAEMEALKAQVATAPASRPSAASVNDADELARLRHEHEELLRLRGEVAAYRQRIAALPKGLSDPGELDRIKAQKREIEDAQSQAMLARMPEIAMIPANSWENAGSATAVSALQTFNWSVRNHNTNAFASVMSWDPQVKARAEALFASLPQAVQEKYGSVDGVVFDWMLNNSTPTAAYRILPQSAQGADDITLIEQHQYVDGRVRENSVQFHRDESTGWRQVIPPALVPKLEIVINNLAGPSAPGGK